MSCKGYKWYSGVPHCHTVASDGGPSIQERMNFVVMNKKWD